MPKEQRFLTQHKRLQLRGSAVTALLWFDSESIGELLLLFVELFVVSVFVSMVYICYSASGEC